MDMLGKVRRMHLRDKLSISEIAKRTGLSRNTIKKWLRAPGDVEPKYRRKPEDTKLSAFEPFLRAALKADHLRHIDSRRTARALFHQIKAQGYEGGYSRVTDFIRATREAEGRDSRAFVPLTFENGEAFQFDWGEEGMLVGGVFHEVQVGHMKLSASRAFFLVAYPTQSHEMLFDAHTRSFAAFGGIPKRGIYDNMKTAVDKVGSGKNCKVNKRFKAKWLLEHLLQAEDTNRGLRSIAHQMKSAKFPIHRDLAGFDFAASPVDKALISTLSDLSFTEQAHNVVLIGGPGTGKTHLATALGISGITQHGKRVRFCSTVDLVNALENEKLMNKTGRIAQSLGRLDLVILDELGYLPLSQAGGALLFHLLSKLYEHTSVMITTNLTFSE